MVYCVCCHGDCVVTWQHNILHEGHHLLSKHCKSFHQPTSCKEERSKNPETIYVVKQGGHPACVGGVTCSNRKWGEVVIDDAVV